MTAEVAEAALTQARAEIDAAWQYIENGYDIESRAELEADAKTNGFQYGLAQAMHHIWKRNPKVEAALTQARAREAQLQEANSTAIAFCLFVRQTDKLDSIRSTAADVEQELRAASRTPSQEQQA